MTQHIRFCTAPDGVRLAYTTIGRGRPLVKAANWLTHIEHDLHNPIWQPVLRRLASGRMLLRYDQRGCGVSDRSVADISFGAWVSDLAAVVECAGLGRFDLLGISQGGAIALAYAARHPDRVAHLVICGGYARGMLRRDPTPERQEAAGALLKLVRHGWGGRMPALRQLFSLQFLPDANAEQLRWFDDLQRVSATADVAARTLAEFDRIDVSDLLRLVEVPTLVLHSRHDARVPFQQGRELASGIRGAQFVPLESRNHLPLGTEPAFGEMMEAIGRFLATDSAAVEPAAYAELTNRERDILHLVAQGLDNAEIADRLSISIKTVRNHVSRVFDKLEVRTRSQAIVRAREAGYGSARADG
ncbi:MAG TPA: alpha/beta fold hydrolase [Gemmatimonadales bacterium]